MIDKKSAFENCIISWDRYTFLYDRGQEPDWHLLRTFLAVMREGSLSGAARRLGLTQPTIGGQIAELEAALGVSLFTRSPRGLLGREQFGFRCDSDPARFAALKAGTGIGGCQDLIAERLPELVPILPDLVRFSLDVWLAMHRDLKETLRVRLLFDHLAQRLKSFLQGKPQ